MIPRSVRKTIQIINLAGQDTPVEKINLYFYRTAGHFDQREKQIKNSLISVPTIPFQSSVLKWN